MTLLTGNAGAASPAGRLLSALSIAVRSGRAAGLQVAIYNPGIDTGGANGRGLAATLREALAASADA